MSTNTKLDESTIDLICKDYLNKHKTKELAIKYGVASTTIIVYLKKRKIWKGSFYSNPKELDETVFNTLTEEAKYWIGFLMADGNVYQVKNKKELPIGQKILTLRLASVDIPHICKLKSFLKSNRPIEERMTSILPNTKKSYPYAGITIRSDIICNKLEEFGIIANKSHNAKAVKIEKDRDFWRGVLDGDGSLWIHTDRRESRKNSSAKLTPYLNLCGSRELMEQFVEYIKYTFPDTKPRRVVKMKTIFSVVIGGKFSVELMNHFYANSTIYLDRKIKKLREINTLFGDKVETNQTPK